MFAFSGSDAAIVDSSAGQLLSYDQVSSLVDQFALLLRRPQKALVFIFCDNSLHSVLFYLAAISSDHATALLDSATDDHKKDSLVDIYKPETIVVCGRDWRPDQAKYTLVEQQHGYSVWHSQIFGQPPHPDLCLLLSTSGSTGSAKMVRLSKQNLLSNAKAINKALSVGEQERAVLSLPIHYSYGLSILNTHLLAGASVMLTSESLTTSAFWSLVRENCCTSFAGVPYSYEILRRLGLEKLHLDKLKTMTQAGGKLSDKLISYFYEFMALRQGNFYVMYGQTEATARISILPSEELPSRIGSVGKAIDGGKLIIEGGREGVGEIVYQGPNVMLGYATTRADLELGDLLKGRLETGDIGYLDEQGFLFVTGRARRIAKIFGQRINLDEVELALHDCGPVAAISNYQALYLYFETLAAEEMAKRRSVLSSLLHLHHSAIITRSIAKIPRTPNGKVDYASLEAEIL